MGNLRSETESIRWLDERAKQITQKHINNPANLPPLHAFGIISSVNAEFADVYVNGSTTVSKNIRIANGLVVAQNDRVLIEYINFNQTDALIVENFNGALNSGISVQSPILLNNWIPYGFSDLQPAFWRNSSGIVSLEGSCKGGTVGTTIFVLDVGYRPSGKISFPIVSNNAFGVIDILVDGSVNIPVGNNARVSLNGISFRAV